MTNESKQVPKAGALIVPVSPFQQNCTLLWNAATMHGVVIDPGGDVPHILAGIKQAGITVDEIWITHGRDDALTLQCQAMGLELRDLQPGWTDPAHPPGAYTPDGLPADPQPALFPGAPVPTGVSRPPDPTPGPGNLADMLLPAEGSQP